MSVVLDALNKAQKEVQLQPQLREDEQKFFLLKTKYRNTLILMILTNLLLLAFLVIVLKLKPSKTRPPGAGPSVSEENASGISGEEKGILLPPRISLSDTAEPEIGKGLFSVPGGPVLNIEGVMIDEEESSVLVNSEFFKQDEEIDGVKILEINFKKIKVDYKGKEYVIPV